MLLSSAQKNRNLSCEHKGLRIKAKKMKNKIFIDG
tara:strand:+ start:5336 stop:5440 length:105 start_codon:yes stop_codon:yes gene_type:complete